MFDGLRGMVREEGGTLRQRRRQPDQVVIDPPEEGRAVRRWPRSEPMFPQLGSHEPVDSIIRPVERILRRHRSPHRPEGPVFDGSGWWPVVGGQMAPDISARATEVWD